MKDISGSSFARIDNPEEEQDGGGDQSEGAGKHTTEGGNHLEQNSILQKTVEGIDGGLHPALDGQSSSEVHSRMA